MSFITVLLMAAWSGGAWAGVGAVMLVLGDSLSAGFGLRVEQSWPALLATRLDTQGYPYQVVNASISGETTAGGSRRLPALLTEHQPRVVVVALGANDGLRGIAPAEVARNVNRMLDAIQAVNATAVLVQVRIPPNYGPQYVGQFEQVFDDVAAERNLLLAPFMLQRFAASASAFQSDGLHPTAAVQDQILETLWPTLIDAIAQADAAETAP